ncbi:unnamed protein product [marine sediment metagenome]|uniref:Uncharacterized protein n=1 Tax=marine sediment metagenome TaxID=412755 RepID=X1LM93_9ZZZZ
MTGKVTPKRLPSPRTMLGHDGTDFHAVKVNEDGELHLAWPDLPTTTMIRNVTTTLADVEYGQAMPLHTRKFLIRCRGNYPIKVAFTENESGTQFVTVPAGMTYWEDLIRPVALTLYFQCPTAGQVAEIVAWS